MRIIFTKHVMDRIKKRKITEDDIVNTLMYPERINKKEGNYYAQKNIGRGKIEVVYEKDKYIKIITVYWIS